MNIPNKLLISELLRRYLVKRNITLYMTLKFRIVDVFCNFRTYTDDLSSITGFIVKHISHNIIRKQCVQNVKICSGVSYLSTIDLSRLFNKTRGYV